MNSDARAPVAHLHLSRVCLGSSKCRSCPRVRASERARALMTDDEFLAPLRARAPRGHLSQAVQKQAARANEFVHSHQTAREPLLNMRAAVTTAPTAPRRRAHPRAAPADATGNFSPQTSLQSARARFPFIQSVKVSSRISHLFSFREYILEFFSWIR